MCYCCENLVHAVHRCDTVLKFWVISSMPGCQSSFNTAQIPDQPSRLPESVVLFLRQCICEVEGTCVMWWKCSTHDSGNHYLEIILDKEVRMKYLSLQDEACRTNILTRLVGLVSCLQVGGGVMFGLTASKLSWSTFKQNSYKSLKNTSTETTSVLSCYRSRRGQETGIYWPLKLERPT
jgi:hypothetical protein